MNPFILSYLDRLKVWHELRTSLENVDVQSTCVEVDNFWQKSPMSSHYLHPDDIEYWPNPWELLNDNTYCYYARGLGMVYTLMLLGIKNIEFVEATDYNNNSVVLVLVDCAKYVMNYWPHSVLNSNLSTFKVARHINIELLYKKIGK